MNQLGLVTSLQVMEDWSIIEIGQVDHVIALLKFWRIHLSHLSWRICLFLEKWRKLKFWALPKDCIYLLTASKTSSFVNPKKKFRWVTNFLFSQKLIKLTPLLGFEPWTSTIELWQRDELAKVSKPKRGNILIFVFGLSRQIWVAHP